MAAWQNPVGSKPKSVYVRRRILVLLALLALVAVVVLIIVKPGGSHDTAPPAGSTPSLDAEPVVQDDGEPVECLKSQLLVKPVTDRNSYASGELPQLSLTITNTGTKSCTTDLGTAGMIFSVTSGSDQIWLSTDCQSQPDHRLVILEPKSPVPTEPITWDRTRSSTGTCDIDRDPVVAGGASYHLRVTAAGVESTDTAQFLLY